MAQRCSILTSVDDLSDGDISSIFFHARSQEFNEYKEAVLMTAFFEPSTRTRLSFEMAAHRLGMGISTFTQATSSQQKGETFRDTIDNLLAMGPDVLVIRSSQSLEPKNFHTHTSIIINGGDGVHEHPTQALADCFTLLSYWRLDNLQGKKILLVGDVAHSRVAHSNTRLMKRLGAEVILLAPRQLQLQDTMGQALQVESYKQLPCDVDAVMCLRIQKERIQEGCLMSDADYRKDFGLSLDRFSTLSDQCVVLHPGPMNVGIEIERDIALHERSLILEQVRHGVVIRAALMSHMLWGKRWL